MKNTFLAILISFSLTSCEKLANTTWMYYDETGCADAWGVSNVPENEKKKNIEKHFKNIGIKIFKTEIINDGTRELCFSCGCKSGKRIKCKIKERDVVPMRNEGFYQ